MSLSDEQEWLPRVTQTSLIEDNLFVGAMPTFGYGLPKNVVNMQRKLHYTIDQKCKLFHAPMEDSGLFDVGKVEFTARVALEMVKDGPTLIHCRAGINRSPLIAARVLMLQGRTADEAIALLRQRRSPLVLSNQAFEDYLRNLP